ncbi:MAG: polyprenyl synthetase family protein [Elusimicrobiota bacterium]
MKTLDAVDDSLARVREGLERRAARLGGRLGDHLVSVIGRPGKMLRARFALLVGAALGVDRDVRERVARVVELIHNASLLQDDCIDEALMRRGCPTPNAQFGDRTGVLLGDLAFTEGMDEALGVSPRAARSLVRSVREMAVGEIQEEFLRGSLDVSVEGYYGLAARKTGALFEWTGEVLSEAGVLPHRREDPPRLGRSAGILLQIVDDIHDVTLDEAVAGKPPGQDLANGRLTLPGILAMDDEGSRSRFMTIWRAVPRDAGRLERALALFEERGHLEAARARARGILDDALRLIDGLPVKAEGAPLKAFMRLMVGREF